MVQHFDQRAAEVLDKTDESNTTVDSLLKLVKTEYEKENTQYLDALLYLCRIGITKRCDMNEDDANMEAEEDIEVLESAPKRRSTQYQSIHPLKILENERTARERQSDLFVQKTLNTPCVLFTGIKTVWDGMHSILAI